MTGQEWHLLGALKGIDVDSLPAQQAVDGGALPRANCTDHENGDFQQVLLRVLLLLLLGSAGRIVPSVVVAQPDALRKAQPSRTPGRVYLFVMKPRLGATSHGTVQGRDTMGLQVGIPEQSFPENFGMRLALSAQGTGCGMDTFKLIAVALRKAGRSHAHSSNIKGANLYLACSMMAWLDISRRLLPRSSSTRSSFSCSLRCLARSSSGARCCCCWAFALWSIRGPRCPLAGGLPTVSCKRRQECQAVDGTQNVMASFCSRGSHSLLFKNFGGFEARS